MKISDMNYDEIENDIIGVDTIRSQATTREAFFKNALLDTFLEYNQVLDNWKKLGKRTGYNDYVSLIKTILTKKLKLYFNPRVVNTELRRCDFGYELTSNKLSKIIVYHAPKFYSVVDSFVEHIKNTDYIKLYREVDAYEIYLKSQEPKIEKQVDEINDINFDQILNIKF